MAWDKWQKERNEALKREMDALRNYVVKPHSCQCKKCKAIMRKHNAWLNKGKASSSSEFAKYFGKKSVAGGSKSGEARSPVQVPPTFSGASINCSSPLKSRTRKKRESGKA